MNSSRIGNSNVTALRTRPLEDLLREAAEARAAGDIRRAGELLGRAARHHSCNPEVHEALGHAQAAGDEFEEAADSFLRSLSLRGQDEGSDLGGEHRRRVLEAVAFEVARSMRRGHDRGLKAESLAMWLALLEHLGVGAGSETYAVSRRLLEAIDARHPEKAEERVSRAAEEFGAMLARADTGLAGDPARPRRRARRGRCH